MYIHERAFAFRYRSPVLAFLAIEFRTYIQVRAVYCDVASARVISASSGRVSGQGAMHLTTTHPMVDLCAKGMVDSHAQDGYRANATGMFLPCQSHAHTCVGYYLTW